MLTALARDPLVHFALLGTGIFLVWWQLTPPPPSDIHIPASLEQSLVRDYTDRTGRTPSSQERQGLLQHYLDDEIMVREAQRHGLDQGDPIVRRRLAQVMRFVWEQRANTKEPTEEALQAWWMSHRDRYPPRPRVDLEHVFFSRERGEDARSRALHTLAKLRDAPDAPRPAADPFLHGLELAGASEARLAQLLGPEAARAVIAMPVGHWAGPVTSVYGEHVVRVLNKEGTEHIAAEHRRELIRDWRAHQREQAVQNELARLRQQYRVLREAP